MKSAALIKGIGQKIFGWGWTGDSGKASEGKMRSKGVKIRNPEFESRNKREKPGIEKLEILIFTGWLFHNFILTRTVLYAGQQTVQHFVFQQVKAIYRLLGLISHAGIFRKIVWHNPAHGVRWRGPRWRLALRLPPLLKRRACMGDSPAHSGAGGKPPHSTAY